MNFSKSVWTLDLNILLPVFVPLERSSYASGSVASYVQSSHCAVFVNTVYKKTSLYMIFDSNIFYKVFKDDREAFL